MSVRGILCNSCWFDEHYDCPRTFRFFGNEHICSCPECERRYASMVTETNPRKDA